MGNLRKWRLVAVWMALMAVNGVLWYLLFVAVSSVALALWRNPAIAVALFAAVFGCAMFWIGDRRTVVRW